MIKTPTTFILGAGASMPYKFPSGTELTEDVTFEIRKNSSLFQALGFSNYDCNEFCNELIRSNSPSIDTFLENRKEFEDIGKFGIALTLRQKENESDLLLPPKKRGVGIYSYIFSEMCLGVNSLYENNISFITLNYERSLEKFFFESYKSFTGRSYEEINEDISRIKIIHLHGTLGKLPYQDKKDGVEYAPQNYFNDNLRVKIRKLRISAENVLTMNEEEQILANYQTVKELIHEAKRVYFIGFGFHKDVLGRLGLDNRKYVDQTLTATRREGWKDFYRGSSKGLGLAEKKRIENKWGIALADSSYDGVDFLKNSAFID